MSWADEVEVVSKEPARVGWEDMGVSWDQPCVHAAHLISELLVLEDTYQVDVADPGVVNYQQIRVTREDLENHWTWSSVWVRVKEQVCVRVSECVWVRASKCVSESERVCVGGKTSVSMVCMCGMCGE